MTTNWSRPAAEKIIAAHRELKGPMLPILHAIQEEFGLIPEEAMRLVAERLNVSRAEVYGVVTFYHDFRQQPAGRHVLKICQAEACPAMGGKGHAAALLEPLNLDWGGTTSDGRLTVEPVYCLGLCASAPSAMLDGRLHARLDGERLEALARETL